MNARFDQTRARFYEEADGPAIAPLSSLPIDAFLSMPLPPRRHLLAPILPEQGLVLIHGPRGLGKTHLSVGIAVAVASGGSFLCWSAAEPMPVLLIDGEMPATALQERLKRAVEAADRRIASPLHIITPDLNRDANMPDLSTREGQAAVDALAVDVKLIIIDNLSCLISGVENEAESWQPLQTWSLRNRAQGRSLVFVHHSGKGGSQRGTSRREDVLDTVLALRRPPDYAASQGARFEVHVEKGRSLHGEDAEPFEAQLSTSADGRQSWTIRPLKDRQGERIAELAALGMKPAEIAAELGIHRATVYRHLKKGNGSA
jgi:KaiC/GvpD/RAD55 family RecA-like ATPase